MSAAGEVRGDELVSLRPWDTEHFGFRIAAVHGPSLDEVRAARVSAWCRSEGVRCVYFLADAGDVDSGLAAASVGWRFIEARLTYGLPLVPGAPVLPDDGARVGDARPEELPVLRAMARGAFSGTRFLRDKGFPRERVAAMYERWVDRDLTEGGVLVARAHDQRPEGFVTWRVQDDRFVIGLVAVAEWARGRGVGHQLLTALRQAAGQAGVHRIDVATQGDNLAAQRLYQAAGFRSERVDYWFHGWTSQMGMVVP